MNSEEPKCGDDCKLVEMLASRTSEEQSMENAIAAVQTGNISVLGAAKRFGVAETSLRRKLKPADDVRQMANHTTQGSEPSRKKPTDEERQEWWRLHTQEGLTTNAIHKKTGRNRETITKEIKRRKGAEVQVEPTSAPEPALTPSAPETTPTPEPTTSVPSSGHSTLREDIQVTPTGELNDHMKALVKRESKSSKDRLKIVAALKEIQIPLEKTMTAASKEFRFGRGIVYQDVMAAERQLAKDGNPSIRETLEEVAREAESVRKFATESLRLLQLDRDEA
jgi:transposase